MTRSIDPAIMAKARAVLIEQELARRGIKLPRQGKELIGPCPRCGGTDRFAVNTIKQVWNCRGCGIGGDVIELVRHLDDVALGEAVKTLTGAPVPRPKPNGQDRAAEPKKVVAVTFDYTDEAGALLFQTQRMEFQNADGSFVLQESGKRKKTFRQRRPNPQRRDGWIYDVDGVRGVPYRLPQLLEAIGNEQTILIVEGEAKVDLLRSWNVSATCCAEGAKKWRPEHSEHLRGADVVVLPDNDPVGREHAELVAASLQDVAACVRMLELPGLAPKGDVIDWAAAGHTVDELWRLIETQAAVWAPASADGRSNEPLPPAGESDNGIEEPAPAKQEGVSGLKSSQQSRPGLAICSSAQFIKDFVPPDYLVDGILQRRFVYSLTGRTGSGKTAELLLLAASTGLGRAIGPHTVEQGRVVYFAGENPDDVRMRWIALAQQMDFDVDTIDVHFIPGAFKISERMDQIKTEIAARGGASLVVVDTSAAYFEGDDENANKPAGEHARRLRSLTELAGGPCVIVACHPPKNAADDNLQPRGGGAFIAEVDGNLTASKDGSVVEMHWQGKFRGPDFAPINFLLRTVTHERLKDSKSRLIPTVVAAHLSEAGHAELATVARTNENRMLEALRDNEDASLADLARELGWMFRSGQPNKMLVKRTLEKLRTAKLATQDRGRWALSDKGRKVVAPNSAANGDDTAAVKSRGVPGRRIGDTPKRYDHEES
jgi:hypothetical protein